MCFFFSEIAREGNANLIYRYCLKIDVHSEQVSATLMNSLNLPPKNQKSVFNISRSSLFRAAETKVSNFWFGFENLKQMIFLIYQRKFCQRGKIITEKLLSCRF